MNIGRMAKLLGKDIDYVERVMESINRTTFELYDMDFYEEFIDIYIHDPIFHKFLVANFKSKTAIRLINKIDDKVFARGIIENLRRNGKLNDKYILENTTGSIIKYMTSIEIQMVIGAKNKVEVKLNYILNNPDDVEYIDYEAVRDTRLNIYIMDDDEIEEAEALNNNDVEQIKKSDGNFSNNGKEMNVGDYFNNQQKYDYLFNNECKEKLFKHCVGGDFENVERRVIDNNNFMRFDLLHLDTHDIIHLIGWLVKNNSIIINDVIYSIFAGHRNPKILIETMQELKHTEYIDYVEKQKLVRLLDGRSDKNAIDNVLAMYNY